MWKTWSEFYGYINSDIYNILSRGEIKLQWWFMILKTSFDAVVRTRKRKRRWRWRRRTEKSKVKHIVTNQSCEFLGESCLFARLAAVDRFKKKFDRKKIGFRKINLRENHLCAMKWRCLWILRVSLHFGWVWIKSIRPSLS